jgi:hypothetical protein
MCIYVCVVFPIVWRTKQLVLDKKKEEEEDDGRKKAGSQLDRS